MCYIKYGYCNSNMSTVTIKYGHHAYRRKSCYIVIKEPQIHMRVPGISHKLFLGVAKKQYMPTKCLPFELSHICASVNLKILHKPKFSSFYDL